MSDYFSVSIFHQTLTGTNPHYTVFKVHNYMQYACELFAYMCVYVYTHGGPQFTVSAEGISYQCHLPVCAVFSHVKTMLQLPVFGICNKNANACDCTWGLHQHHKSLRACTKSWFSVWERNPMPHQRITIHIGIMPGFGVWCSSNWATHLSTESVKDTVRTSFLIIIYSRLNGLTDSVITCAQVENKNEHSCIMQIFHG